MNNFLRKSIVLVLILFSFCFFLYAADSIQKDSVIRDSVKSINLNGHTITVEESGIVLEKCTDGEIIIASSVGPGLVTLKNCSRISVVLESNVCLLLDNKTKIETLIIRENALVDSLEFFLAESKGKKYEQKKKAHVNMLLIESSCSPVLKNFDYEAKQEVFNDSEHNYNAAEKDSQELKITQDKTYKGLGVRLLIENAPENADSISVFLKDDESERGIDWFSKQTNRDRFYSDFYEYKYLDAGKEYEFIFWYSNDQKILDKYYIKVVPEKGSCIIFDNSNVQLEIDENIGFISWKSVPFASFPKNTELVYDMISFDSDYNWHYVGSYATDYADYSSFNLYEKMKWDFPENIVDGKVFLHVFYRYKSNRWDILQTPSFDVKAGKK